MKNSQEPAVKDVADKIEKEGEKLLSAIFDFRFEKFATIKIVTVVYVLGILGAIYLAYTIVSEEDGDIIGGLFLFAFLVLILRVILEFIVVQFRTAENTSNLVDLLAKREEGGGENSEPVNS